MSENIEPNAAAEAAVPAGPVPESTTTPQAPSVWERWKHPRSAPATGGSTREKLPGPAKIADQPHPWTVWLSLMTPMAAALALYFTYSSYETARRSLETSQRALAVSEEGLRVGQRAYLRIENGRFDIRRTSFLFGASADVGGKRQVIAIPRFKPAVEIPVSFEVHNSGNTPANVVELKLKFVLSDEFGKPQRTPEIWLLDDVRDDGNNTYTLALNNLGAVPGRGRIAKRFGVAADFRETRSPTWIQVEGELAFDDVFGARQTLRWCEQQMLIKPMTPRLVRS
jgi:hypothetical protein